MGLTLGWAGSGRAAISLIGQAAFANGDVTVGTRMISPTDLGGFSAAGADKLVVTIGGEGSGNGAGNNTVLSVTYNGVFMSEAVASASGNRRNSIWFLDGVVAGGDFVITFQEDQDGIGFGAYALNGTLPGFADTSVSGGVSTLQIDTTTPGEFVVASMARNNFDELSGAGTDGTGQPANLVGVQPPLTELYYENLTGSSAAGGYAILSTPGSHDLTIYENNGSGNISAAAFQAAVVPEPSAFLLGALGALGLCRRRR